MLPTPPLCRRAVQRSLRSSSDNVWITDDILATAFQRFCVISGTSRRHGSSVPGPMECRRRVGKRRMAHLVEAGNAPMFNVGALFGGFDTVDRTEWRWEPPTARSEIQKDNHKLPEWLTSNQHVSDIIAAPLTVHPIAKETSIIRDYEEDLDKFLRKMQTASNEEIEQLCRQFNQDVKQGLMLGGIMEDTILSALQLVPQNIYKSRLAKGDSELFCMEFFTSIWKGYQACKVLKIQDVGGHIFDTLLCGFAKLPRHFWHESEAISAEILRSISVHQLEGMSQGIDAIVERWAINWLDQRFLIDDKMETTPSVLALSTLLGYLPQKAIEQALPRLTKKAITAVRSRKNTNMIQLESFKRSWALMVANLSSISQNTFVQTWQTLDYSMSQEMQIRTGYISATVRSFNEREGIALVIEYWISHGQFKDSKRIRGSYLFKRQDCYHGHIADLLAAIDRRRDGCWTQARGIFALLRRVQMDDMIPKTLELAPKIGLKVPASLIASEIRELSLQNKMGTALRVYKSYPLVRFDNVPLNINGLHEMIIGLIKNPAYHPLHIWAMCRIYLSMPGAVIRRPAQRDRYHYRKPSKQLEEQRVVLIKKMAKAFAHANHLYSDASHCPAYRNVRQCIRYLSLYNEKPSPEVSKALVYIGIIKPLKAGHGPATERVNYILAYVRQAEGEEAAYAIDVYVQRFRDHRIAVEAERRRLSNPLRLGVID